MTPLFNLRPKWWQLYLTFPLLIGLFVLDHRLRLSTRGHLMLQIGILLLVYGLIYMWLKANAFALSRGDQEQDHPRLMVLRVPISQLPDPDPERGSILDLPASEIKDVLSDTFEVEYIDAKALPIHEVSQELKKE
jgi:hypothetical protein